MHIADDDLPDPLKDVDPMPDVGPTMPDDLDNEEEVVEWLESQPERRRELIVSAAQYFSGPLPPPDLLREYDNIVPGFAQTIVDQFVAQGNHRRELEKKVIFGDVIRANWGLAAGFILAIIGVLGSLYIINSGKAAAGITTFILSLATLVGSFLEATRRRRQEREQKAIEMPE